MLTVDPLLLGVSQLHTWLCISKGYNQDERSCLRINDIDHLMFEGMHCYTCMFCLKLFTHFEMFVFYASKGPKILAGCLYPLSRERSFLAMAVFLPSHLKEIYPFSHPEKQGI